MSRKPAFSPAASIGQVRQFGARLLDRERHDPYQPKAKHREMRCFDCGALYKSGRWQWSAIDPACLTGTCPACRRTADRMPAGRISLQGPYTAEHQADLVRIAQHARRRLSAPNIP